MRRLTRNLLNAWEADIQNFLEKNPDVKREDIPTDLLTASRFWFGSSHFTGVSEIQIPRIVKASGLEETKVREIIKNNTDGKLMDVFGEETVNVVKVNIEIGAAMGLFKTES